MSSFISSLPLSLDDAVQKVGQVFDDFRESLFSELMNNDTHDFEALSRKYNGFFAPCYKILAGGMDMAADLGLHADSVQISQTIRNKAGSCRFTIQNAYNMTTHRFQDAITAHFPLGQEVSAGLGYGHARPLFKGYVSDVSFSFGQGGAPSATILCNDMRALMQQGRLNAMLPIASFPIMMVLLMAYYTSLLNMRIIYFDFWNTLEDFRQNSNDFQYLWGYAEKRGYEFFVLGNHCYFRKKYLFHNPITTLTWGENLLSFDRNFTYSASQLKGTLNNLLSLLPFGFDELLRPSYPFKSATLLDPSVQMDTSAAKNTLDLINIMASQVIKLGDDMVGGSVRCVGLPEIIPGRYIKIKGLDAKLLDKDYYIEETEHVFSQQGYTTTFQIASGK